MKNFFLALCTSFSLLGCAGMSEITETGIQVSQAAGYNPEKLVSAIKDALKLSVARATDTLSAEGGYAQSALYRMDWPENVAPYLEAMEKLGLGKPIDGARQSMNRAAEVAAGEAKLMLTQAVDALSIGDAISIVRGGDTAATVFFERATRDALASRYQGMVESQLKQFSFYDSYKKVLQAYQVLPMRNKPELDLESMVVQRGLNALYSEMAKEEQAIRANPVEQGNLLIASVFGRK